LSRESSASASSATTSAGKTAGGKSSVIAIDLGNSAAKWCIDDQPESRVLLRSPHWAEQLIAAVSEATDPPRRWRIASVNRPITKMLVGRLNDELPADDVHLIDCHNIPIPARVANPDRVGIDRLLAAWMASRVFAGQASIVVDAGSAITIDVVSNDGAFLGGAIMPGIALQFDALARGTDALPAIDVMIDSGEATTADSFAMPATDTISAIRTGVWLGAAAAIDGLIGHHMNRMNAGQERDVFMPIVFTGGDSELLSRLSRYQVQWKPRWVLDAISSLE